MDLARDDFASRPGMALSAFRARTIAMVAGAKTGMLAMKSLVFGVGILVFGFVAATPARADFTVVRFADGYCQIWWGASATPWGDNWTKIAFAPDWDSAWSALQTAINNRTCQ
jgi:hypothetical protein